MLRVGLVVVIVLSSIVSVVLGGALTGLKGGNMMQPFCRSGSYRPDAGDLLPASGNAPYSLKIVTKVNQYRAGQAIEVTLEGVNGKRFKGFFITNDCVQKQLMVHAGNFQPKNSQFAKTTQFCGDDGVTHTGINDKISVTFYWTPPPAYSLGRCQFKATVVENDNVFYTGVLSNSLAADPNCQNQAEMTNVLNEWKTLAPNAAGGNQRRSPRRIHGLTDVFNLKIHGVQQTGAMRSASSSVAETLR
ncbi:hypothetical protein C0Q70_02341 [Pomacea canaliculata]|uniref:Reelin domain-containing protein n=1 Tax=Pomacea canaliculata TaxID=400727 RepID=A0A2T7PPM7_POMCA|nr:hypothetical protein C0Q70_02341 [Pomacea canaliculata]